MQRLIEIANNFNVDSVIIKVESLAIGNINTTYVAYSEKCVEYILQRKNKNVFSNIPAMMDNIIKVTAHIKNKAKNKSDNITSTITHIQAKTGKYYFVDNDNEYWTLSLRIPNSFCYDTLTNTKMIASSGKGLAIFQNYLADFNYELFETISGFHNIKSRFNQWDEAISLNKANRIKGIKSEIEAIEIRRKNISSFFEMISNESLIPKRVSHNDTKPSNILFNKFDELICIIDLDTVMKNTILYDFGDAIRTHVNTAAEDEPDTKKVNFNTDYFKAYTTGYLEQASNFITKAEKSNLTMSAIYICYEQYLRFLMDYINGDTYYKINYPEHNIIRAKTQYKLLLDLENNYDKMQNFIDNY
jgi:thiamine kinase-like enzyme